MKQLMELTSYSNSNQTAEQFALMYPMKAAIGIAILSIGRCHVVPENHRNIHGTYYDSKSK
jgi:hypothetical protein